MRERNQIEDPTFAPELETASNHLVEFVEREELRDREFSDGNHESRPKNLELIVHPGGAVADLVGRGNAITTGWRFTRETAADGCEIDLRPHPIFSHAAEFIEPTEQRSAGGPGERTSQNRFFHSGSLTDEYHSTNDGTAGNRRREHVRALAALPQLSDMLIESKLSARWKTHPCEDEFIGERKTRSRSAGC